MQYEEYKKNKSGYDITSSYTSKTKKQKQAAVVTQYEEVVDNRNLNYAKLDKNLEIKRLRR